MDFDKAAQAMIDKMPKKNKNNQSSQEDMMLGMDVNQTKMILSMIPRKQKILIVFVVIFTLYGAVSSIIDLVNLITWLF